MGIGLYGLSVAGLILPSLFPGMSAEFLTGIINSRGEDITRALYFGALGGLGAASTTLIPNITGPK
jgi:hypothetical protein